jgi:hypothetical protein
MPSLLLSPGSLDEPQNGDRDRLARKIEKPRAVARLFYGEGQNRTGDTTVFSRVLYQLSYLARAGEV